MPSAADLEVVGDQRRGAGDVGLDPGRRRSVGHDLADGVDRLVGHRLTLIAPQVQLHQSGLAVLALRAGRGQRIAPEVLDVLDVLGVRRQLLDQGVVELVGVGAQGLIAFEDDHRVAVGIELAEDLADVLHRLQRRRIGRALRHRMSRADDLQLWGEDVRQRGDGDPEDGDRHGESPDVARRPSNARPAPPRGARSCGLVQAGDVAVHVAGGPFVLDDAVDGDAAGERVGVPLGAQVGEQGGISGRQQCATRAASCRRRAGVGRVRRGS